MSRQISALVQSILVVLQTLNAGHVFGPHEALVATVLAAIQAGLALYVHGINTDGTPQEVPFIKRP